jgi:hypothetical protein
MKSRHVWLKKMTYFINEVEIVEEMFSGLSGQRLLSIILLLVMI